MQRLIFILSFVVAALVIQGAHAYSGEPFVVCDLDSDGDNWLALRAEPNSRSALVKKLGPGTFLETSDPEPRGKWRQVTVLKGANDWHGSGPIGWVYINYICPYQGPLTMGE